MYLYVCPECQARVEVIRAFSEYENAPTEEEVKETSNDSEVAKCNHKWTREISQAPKHQYGSGWQGRKGYW